MARESRPRLIGRLVMRIGQLLILIDAAGIGEEYQPHERRRERQRPYHRHRNGDGEMHRHFLADRMEPCKGADEHDDGCDNRCQHQLLETPTGQYLALGAG